MNPDQIANVFAGLDRELWIVTAAAGPRRGGLVATFVGQASIAPELPRVVAGIAKTHRTWDLIEASGAFALHLVGDDQLDRVWRFGLQSGRDADKLADLETRRAATGSPILGDAPGWLDCRVEARFDIGDRTLYLAEVVDGRIESDRAWLTMHGLLRRAPAEKRAELKRQLRRDGQSDAAAIRDWREGQG